eukprot:7384588-Prymnesium_polylepis.1
MEGSRGEPSRRSACNCAHSSIPVSLSRLGPHNTGASGSRHAPHLPHQSTQGEWASGRTSARARARGDQAGGYWCMTGRSVGLSVHGQRCPACPDRAKVDRSRSVPLPKSSSPAAARDAWRR